MLQNHRKVGGHIITGELSLAEYKYILDGQQRTVSLLTSLYGGQIKGKEDFDPSLYIDLTISGQNNDLDEISYKERFLFWEDIDDRDGQVKRNVPRKKRYNEGFIAVSYTHLDVYKRQAPWIKFYPSVSYFLSPCTGNNLRKCSYSSVYP